MAQVHLPLGYPEISGQQFANVIYQGTIVRLYDVPADPRTDAQTWERKLFSDMARMRATLGPWVRGALKASLGSRWATVLLQIVKAKLNPWWDDAVEAWGGFGSANKEAWRTAAPYQATFNDPGMIFFALEQTIYQAILFYSGFDWKGVAYLENQSADGLAWWISQNAGGVAVGSVNEQSDLLNYFGLWESIAEPMAGDGVFIRGSAAGESRVLFYIIGRKMIVRFARDVDYGVMRVRLDGKDYYDLNQVGVQYLFGYSQEIDFLVRGIHAIEFVALSGFCSFDSLFVQ